MKILREVRYWFHWLRWMHAWFSDKTVVTNRETLRILWARHKEKKPKRPL